MFGILKRKVKLFAPVNGKIVALKDVPDKVFASEMMGKGVAFTLESGTVYAPCSGEITMVPNSMHAIGMKTGNQAEVLLHIGLDTVNLNGKGFTALVHVGDKVKLGDPLVTVDRELINKLGYNLVTMMIVTNSNDYDVTLGSEETVSAGETEVLMINQK
ncbi:PTS glucose transporter subunit IIA [Erwinia sp. CPCC 100877]|nr:PTS glucose transporter subunit IIA [Erwinia sp. CPCC 100877]